MTLRTQQVAGFICRQCRASIADSRQTARINTRSLATVSRSSSTARLLASKAQTSSRPIQPAKCSPVVSVPSVVRARHSSTGGGQSQSTLDPQEISHFGALAGSWWDPHGPSRLLHLMNPLRHRFIQTCLGSTPETETNPTIEAQSDPSNIQRRLKYLDVGCGGGIFAESAARLRNTASVIAIDPTKEVLAVAEKHRQQDPLLFPPDVSLSSSRPQLHYINTAIEDLDASLQNAGLTHAADGQSGASISQYDVVTLFEVIEHVNSPSSFLEHAAAHVKPGGWLILSTIARTPLSYIITKTFAEDLLRIVPRGTHEWSKYVNSEEISQWFDGANARYAQSEGRLASGRWDSAGQRVQGVVYVPGLGWKEVPGSEKIGNYFFGIRKIE